LGKCCAEGGDGRAAARLVVLEWPTFANDEQLSDH
jgi:hypothetical protein